MLKSISKFLTGLMTLVLTGSLLVGSVQAAVGPKFNHMSDDADFLTARNVTNADTNYVDPLSNVKASDEVEVKIYYHNGIDSTDPDATAKNVQVKINLPTSESSSHRVTGSLSADNAATITGSILDSGAEIGQKDLTINTTAPTTMEFVPGSVKWFPNRMSLNGAGANLPNGQTGDALVTATGINLGDIQGCWQFAGQITFKVKFKGQVITPKRAIVDLKKEVRKAGTTDAWVTQNTVKPGENVEYRITVRNVDGQGIAQNVRLNDVLPSGMTYIGPTQLIRNNVTTNLPDGITTAAGILVMTDLQPLEQVYVTFIAQSAITFKNDDCVINKVNVTAQNSDLPTEKQATTCFIVIAPTPTPTPTPVPSQPPVVPEVPKPQPKPKPVLPKTGPAEELMGIIGLAGAAGTTGRFYLLKRNLKKQARDITVL